MSATAAGAVLELRSINTYIGAAHILSDVSLSVGPGETVVLLGRNGAGKSTTLKSIIGLTPVATGTIALRGERIERSAPHEVARLGVGYVPEERRIFTGLTVRENLLVGIQPARTGAPRWTLEKLFALFPNLAEMQDRRAAHMSGGEQQMLAIARTLMGNPLCLLLDEPSEGLAPVIVESLVRAVRELKAEGVSVLLSEQNWSVAAALADRACLLEQGRVRYSGTIAELAQNEALREAGLSI